MKLSKKLKFVRDNVTVLRDLVLVQPIPYEHPVLETPTIKIQKGLVITVGYGRRQRQKVYFNQQMGYGGKKMAFEDGPETGRITPMQVKSGDVVEFSFREIKEVDFDTLPDFRHLKLGKLAFVKQQAIYGVDTDDDEAFLWQQSAGFDRNGQFMSGAEDWHRV